MPIQYQEHDLDDIMRYFAKDFKPKKGRITKYEYRIDTHLRQVIFIIYTDEPSNPKETNE